MAVKDVITSSKSLIIGTAFIVAGLLTTGLLLPESFIMSFANTNMEYAVIRIILLVVLFTLLITNPPRSRAFRMALLCMAAIFISSSFYLLSSYKIGILDALVFIEVSIIFVVEALELKQRASLSGRPSARQAIRHLRISYK